MTVKYSRNFKNQLMGGRSARSILEDCVLYAYDGTVPTNPEDTRAVNNKLCKFTTSHLAVASTDRSTKTLYAATIGTGCTPDATVIANITVDNVGPTSYTYVVLAADNSDAKVAVKVARMLDDIPQLSCIATGITGAFYLQSRIAGLDFTLANGGGTYTITPGTKVFTAARVYTLQFSVPALGVISMETGAVWEGTNLLGGTAGNFILALPSDPLTADTGYIYPRVTGTLATVGGDATIDPAILVISAISSITSFTLTLPTS
jgi:hypothetical protein